MIGEEGSAHEKRFAVEVTVSCDVGGKGAVGSKKEAERAAAQDALRKLGY